MLNTIRNIFGRNKKVNTVDKDELISYATMALMGTGQYASYSMTDDWNEWAEKMQHDLRLFEQKAFDYSSPELFILAGRGWECFSIWYRRKNDDKTTPLKKAISMFEEALKIESDHEGAKIGMASLLIERVQVRNLERAINILNDIPNKTDEVQVLLGKANRWTGNIELESDFDYTKIQLIPLTFLREERKKCRALVKSLKKDLKSKELIKVLGHMYRIAIIHDAATHVMLNYGYIVNPKQYDASYKDLETITKKINEYSYHENGELVESNNCFFSRNDYKIYELVFGKSDKTIDPTSLIKN